MSASRPTTTTATLFQKIARRVVPGMQAVLIGPVLGKVQNNGFGRALTKIGIDYLTWVGPAVNHMIGDIVFDVGLFRHPGNYIWSKGGGSYLRGLGKIAFENMVGFSATYAYGVYMISQKVQFVPGTDERSEFDNALLVGMTSNAIFQIVRGLTASAINRHYPAIEEKPMTYPGQKTLQVMGNIYGNSLMGLGAIIGLGLHGYEWIENPLVKTGVSMVANTCTTACMHVVGSPQPFGEFKELKPRVYEAPAQSRYVASATRDETPEGAESKPLPTQEVKNESPSSVSAKVTIRLPSESQSSVDARPNDEVKVGIGLEKIDETETKRSSVETDADLQPGGGLQSETSAIQNEFEPGAQPSVRVDRNSATLDEKEQDSTPFSPSVRTALADGIRTPLLGEVQPVILTKCEDVTITGKAIGRTVKGALPTESMTYLLAGRLYYSTYNLFAVTTKIGAKFFDPSSASQNLMCGLVLNTFMEGGREMLKNGGQRLFNLFSCGRRHQRVAQAPELRSVVSPEPGASPAP